MDVLRQRQLARAPRGDADRAVAAVTPALEAAAHGSGMFARELAHVYALAGQTDPALDWLERAVDLGLLHHEFLVVHDGFLAALRPDPRFRALLTRVEASGLPARPAQGSPTPL